MRQAVDRSWLPWALLGIGSLIVLAPMFDWAAGAVGYTEPLEQAAVAAGAMDAAVTIHSGFMPAYTVPGFHSSLGTLFAAASGTALTFVVVIGLGRLLEQ